MLYHMIYIYIYIICKLLHPTYTTSTPPIYAHLPYLPLIIGTPYHTTFEQ